MSDTPATTPPAPRPEAAGAFDLRVQVIAAYVLFLLAWMNGITALIGVILAYVKRHEASGTIWRSHFDNLILVFWVMVAGLFLGLLTWPISLGLRAQLRSFQRWSKPMLRQLWLGPTQAVEPAEKSSSRPIHSSNA